MRKAARFLLYASRVFAACAVLAGLAMGFLAATLGAGLTCFDNCPAPGDFFARLVPGAINLISPCVALESLALVTFLAYCAATRQPRRAITVTLVSLAGGVVGIAALYALMLHGQATLPVSHRITNSKRVLWKHGRVCGDWRSWLSRACGLARSPTCSGLRSDRSVTHQYA